MGAKQRTEEEKRGILAELDKHVAAGGNKEAFCRERGMSSSSIWNWKHGIGLAKNGNRHTAKPKPHSNGKFVAFAPVTEGQIKISLPSGVTISCPMDNQVALKAVAELIAGVK